MSDASGNATWQGAIAFSASDVAESNLPVGQGSTTTIPFMEESYDTGNNFLTNTFTAPVTGIYHFNATIT